MEADWRSASMTLVVVRIGFEKIQPSGRRVPKPVILEEFLDLADQLRADAERTPPPWNGEYNIRSEFSSRWVSVCFQRDRREELWEAAQEETRDSILGVRLTPGRYEWLGRRAKEQETSRSSLLRARALEGIRNQSQFHQMSNRIDDLLGRATNLQGKVSPSTEYVEDEEIRSGVRALAEEIESTVARWEEKY